MGRKVLQCHDSVGVFVLNLLNSNWSLFIIPLKIIAIRHKLVLSNIRETSTYNVWQDKGNSIIQDWKLSILLDSNGQN